jgi:hypothetical protein
MEINEVELACKLADIKVKEELLGTELKYKTEEDLFIIRHEDEQEVLYYKEEPQEVFNRWYDYYWSLIVECKSNFKNKKI